MDNNPLCAGPRGSREQLKTPIGASEGPRIDEPIACTQGNSGMDHGAYIRVHGQGTRRLVLGGAAEQNCVPPPGAAPDVCPEISADVVGNEVSRLLQARGIEINGVGAGVCAQPEGTDFDTWRYSVGITDWKDADAAIATVDEVLRKWGIGHHFGISVRGIDCTAVPL